MTKMEKSLLKGIDITTDHTILKKNIKSNWIFIVSSFFLFLCLAFFNLCTESVIGIFVAVFANMILFSQIKNVISWFKSASKKVIILAILSSIGVCKFIVFTQKFDGIPHKSMFLIINTFFSIFGLPYLLVFMTAFYQLLLRKLNLLLSNISKEEYIVYGFILIFELIFVTFMFSQSVVFYYSHTLDALFTSDSSSIVYNNSYLSLFHLENDLRQPLFAVFASPLISIGYLAATPLTHFISFAEPLMMNYVQLGMLLISNVMFSFSMKTSKFKRILFVILMHSTYTVLLFSLMMEQYIVGYFYLSLLIYDKLCNEKRSNILLTAATGSLLTNSIFAFLMIEDKNIKQWKNIIIDIVRSALVFFFIVITAGRADVVIFAFDKFWKLKKFASVHSFSEKICQYTHFVSDCFVYPDTIVKNSNSLQLSDNHFMTINYIGIIIFITVAIGACITRKEMITRVASVMVFFSILLLVIAGWGSPENGMILYSLYFYWSFSILIFQLITWIEKKLNCKYITLAFSVIILVAMINVNTSAIKELYTFAIGYGN